MPCQGPASTAEEAAGTCGEALGGETAGATCPIIGRTGGAFFCAGSTCLKDTTKNY